MYFRKKLSTVEEILVDIFILMKCHFVVSEETIGRGTFLAASAFLSNKQYCKDVNVHLDQPYRMICDKSEAISPISSIDFWSSATEKRNWSMLNGTIDNNDRNLL